MAIDEMLLKQVIEHKSPNTLRFYQWEKTTASIGQHQSLAAEINTKFAKKYDIDIVRRISGGGAVLHDATKEITYAIICRLDDIPKNFISPRIYASDIPQRYVPILESLASGLENLGVPIDVSKIHCPSLLTKGKKISGNAQIIRKNVLLQHGTILLDVDPPFMYKILKAPKGVSYSKMVQSVRMKVSGINEYVKLQSQKSSEIERICESLKKGFESIFHSRFFTKNLTKTELTIIEQLITSKYSKKDWLKKYP